MGWSYRLLCLPRQEAYTCGGVDEHSRWFLSSEKFGEKKNTAKNLSSPICFSYFIPHTNFIFYKNSNFRKVKNNIMNITYPSLMFTKVYFNLFVCILFLGTHVHTHMQFHSFTWEQIADIMTSTPGYCSRHILLGQIPSSHPRSFIWIQLCHLKYNPYSKFPSAQIFPITFFWGSVSRNLFHC